MAVVRPVLRNTPACSVLNGGVTRLALYSVFACSLSPTAIAAACNGRKDGRGRRGRRGNQQTVSQTDRRTERPGATHTRSFVRTAGKSKLK